VIDTPKIVSTPPETPSSATPVDLHPTSDIRFVIVEVTKLTTKVDRLIDDVHDFSTTLISLERTIDRFRTGAIVAAVILSSAAGVFWWALGDRIGVAVRTALYPPASEAIHPTVPPPSQDH
jgi:hypothetical protein